MSSGRSANPASVPKINRFLLGGFERVAVRMLRKEFHVVAVSRSSHTIPQHIPDGPLIVFANHPGWWDPLVGMFVCAVCLPERNYYAPIDQDALAQYRIFARLGYYGIELETASGAANFLQTSMAILKRPENSLWITPEGRFTDPRDHSTPLMPGVAHLASRLDAGTLLPLALEYSFWEERKPCIFFRFGSPLSIAATDRQTKHQWTERIARALRSTQAELADEVIARDADLFLPLLRSRTGSISGRLIRGAQRLAGRNIREEHSDKFQ